MGSSCPYHIFQSYGTYRIVKKNQVLDGTGRNVKKQWLAVTLVNSHQWRSFMGVPIKPDDLELYTEVNSKHMDYIYDPP